MSFLLMGILAALAAGAGWMLFLRRGTAQGFRGQRDTTLPDGHRLWKVAPAPHDFFAAPQALAVNAEEFAAGVFGAGASGAEGNPPTLRVCEYGLGTDLSALLTGSISATYAVVPEEHSHRVPAAAAGAGVMAWAVESSDIPEGLAAHVDQVGSASGRFTAHPEPGWLLGLDAAGHPVEIQLVPGSTILVHGGGRAEQLCERLPASSSWVRLINAETLATKDGESKGLGERWRDAWDPTVCRVVLVSSLQDATAHNILPDLIINARGVIKHRGRKKHFEPLERLAPLNGHASPEGSAAPGFTPGLPVGLLDPSASEGGYSSRTARVSDARAARSASFG